MTEKRCSSCGETKPVDQFYRLGRSRDGRQGYCKVCANRKRKVWAKANPNRERDWRQNAAPRNRERQLVWNYGMTADEYDQLLESQRGGCATCGKPPSSEEKRFPVDHDHSCCPGKRSCGKCVRGILCHGCNNALGNARDSASTLRALADYLDRNNQCKPEFPPR